MSALAHGRLALLAGAALAIAPAPAAAQWRAEATLGARATRTDARPTAATTLLGLAASRTTPRLQLLAVADAGAPAADAATYAAETRVALEAWAHGPWRLGLGVTGGHARLDVRAGGGDARAVARAAWVRAGRIGLWAEGGPAGAWHTVGSDVAPIDTTRRDPGADTTLMAGDSAFAARGGNRRESRMGAGTTRAAGGWVRVRGVLVTASVRGTVLHRGTDTTWRLDHVMRDTMFIHRDSQTFRDETTFARVEVPVWSLREAARRLAQTDAVVGADWRHGRLALHGTAGLRMPALGFAGRAEEWGTARATIAMGEQVGVVATATRHASEPLRGLPRRGEAQLGVVLRPWGARADVLPSGASPGARRFATVPAGTDSVTFRLEAPGARDVELMASFTGWRPVAMRRERGRWAVTLPVGRGVHQLNVRVDGGAWSPPPGVTAADDGFGGRVGILVIE